MHGYVGILVAIVSNVLIGSGIAFKKIASKRADAFVAANRDKHPTQEDRCFRVRMFFWRHGAMLQWTWWLGLFVLIIGECSNFYAYTLAPAFIIVLLGSVSVFTTQCVAFITGEWFNGINILGVVIALLATTAVLTEVPHAPSTVATSIPRIAARVIDPSVLTLLVTDVFVAVLVFTAVFVYRIKMHAQRAKNMGRSAEQVQPTPMPMFAGMVVYACAGGLTVITTKAVGVLLVLGISEHKFYFDKWYMYAGVAFWMFLVGFQLYMLNALLSSGDSSLVSPLL